MSESDESASLPGDGLPPAEIAPQDATGEAPIVPAADPGTTAARGAYEERLRRAGRFAGQGYPEQWIADRFGVTTGTVRKWQSELPFIEGYAAAEDARERAAALGLMKIGLVLGELVDISITVAKDTAHKDSSAERRYLIDKIMPTVQVQQSRTHHTADVRFWEPVSTALTRIAEMPRAAVPQLIEGRVAAEEYGAVPTGARHNGNGSEATLAEREVGTADRSATAETQEGTK